MPASASRSPTTPTNGTRSSLASRTWAAARSPAQALGKVLTPRADLEHELGQQAEAVELQERVLRYLYLAGSVAGIAGSHFNLAHYLGRRPDALPHGLAAALIRFQT